MPHGLDPGLPFSTQIKSAISSLRANISQERRRSTRALTGSVSRVRATLGPGFDPKGLPAEGRLPGSFSTP